MMRLHLQLRTFSRIRMRVLYHGNPSDATPMEEVCGPRQGRLSLLKNKPHLFIFDHCIIVSILTFQPTLVLAVVCDYLCSWKVARLVAIKARMPHGARTVDARSLVITCLLFATTLIASFFFTCSKPYFRTDVQFHALAITLVVARHVVHKI